MNNKLIILQGLPGVGKTKKAKKLAEKDPYNTIIVSRDIIRNMFGKYWVPKRESLITEVEDNIITTGLYNGNTVIIDFNNLNPSIINRLCNIVDALNKNTDSKADVEIIEIKKNIIYLIIKALFRMIIGKKCVKPSVIYKLYKRYYGNN